MAFFDDDLPADAVFGGHRMVQSFDNFVGHALEGRKRMQELYHLFDLHLLELLNYLNIVVAPDRDEFGVFEAQNCSLAWDLLMGVMWVVF